MFFNRSGDTSVDTDDVPAERIGAGENGPHRVPCIFVAHHDASLEDDRQLSRTRWNSVIFRRA